MKKAKKILLTAGAYILTAALAIGGTVAYLQSEDSDVNVMTLGNVKIEQHEYERVVDENGNYTTADIDGVKSYELKEFTQEKPLYPIVGDPSESKSAYAGWDDTIVRMTQVDSYGSMQVFAGKNAQDKFVTVENTGKSDAYIRTIVAIEIGSTDGTLIGTSHHNTWSKNEAGTISIDGNNYMVIEYMYAGGKLSDGTWRHEGGVLPAGDTSYPSLSQVYLKHNATNEDMEKIDGNKNGALDIIVLSQAVQSAGFENAKTALDTAFGNPSEKAAEWFGGILEDPFALVTVLDNNDTITNADGDVVVLDKNLEIDTTDSKMGLDLGKIKLDTAYQFEPYMSAEEGDVSEFADWHADFIVKVDKDIPAYSIGLAGYYDAWCSFNDDKWVMLASDAEIKAGTEIRLVEAMSGGSITVSYRELCQYGNDGIGFLCGAIDLSGKEINGQTVAPLPAGTTLTVELRLYEATDGSIDSETENYITTGTYSYTF